MDAGQVWGSSVCKCVSDSEIGCTRRRACDSKSVRLLSDGVTHLSPRVLTQMPGGSGGCQTGWLVCGCDRLCITAYTRLSGPKGATWHPSWTGWQAQRLWWGRMGRFRGEESRVPILPHPAPPGRPTNGKKCSHPGQARWPPGGGTALCTENKFFWYQLEFGRKWLLGGRKLDSAHISSGRGAGEQLSGVKQSYREEGPQHPIPDRAGGHSPPLLVIWDINGPRKGLPPIKHLLGPRLQATSISHHPHGADRCAD